jgi:hypothetical protein
MDTLAGHFLGEEKPSRLQSILADYKDIILAYIKREKGYIRDREGEFKNIIAVLTTRVSKNASSRAFLVLVIWASWPPSHASVSGPINGIFGVDSVISWRPEIPAFLTTFPGPAMPILIVGIAQAKALMFDLASPAASKRQKGRSAAYPLLTTRRFDQRRLGIATKPTMLAGNWLGFHAVVSPETPLVEGGRSRSALPSADQGTSLRIILCSGLICGLTCTSRYGLGLAGWPLRDTS